MMEIVLFFIVFSLANWVNGLCITVCLSIEFMSTEQNHIYYLQSTLTAMWTPTSCHDTHPLSCLIWTVCRWDMTSALLVNNAFQSLNCHSSFSYLSIHPSHGSWVNLLLCWAWSACVILSTKHISCKAKIGELLFPLKPAHWCVVNLVPRKVLEKKKKKQFPKKYFVSNSKKQQHNKTDKNLW